MTFQVGMRISRDTGPLLAELWSLLDYFLLEFVPGRPLSPWQLHALNFLGESKPVTLHGFHSLSTPGVFGADVLGRIRDALNRSHAAWYSEHICFGVRDEATGQFVTLAPPLDAQTIDAIAENAIILRKHLNVPVLLENLGRPAIWPWDEIDELAAIRRLVDQTGCGLLLDLAQAATSAHGRRETLLEYIHGFPAGAIREIHVGPEAQAAQLGAESLEALHVLIQAGDAVAITLEDAEQDHRVATRCIQQLRSLLQSA